MPAEALEILRKLDQASPPARSSDLDLAQPFATKFWDKYPEGWAAHGTDILDFLAEKIPDAQFVISDSLLEFGKRCELLDEGSAAAGWTKLEAYFAEIQKTLSDTITRYGLNFVHLSWGMTYDGVVRSFQYFCANRSPSREVADRIQRMYITLFRALTSLSSPGADGQPWPVLLFHAGAAVGNSEDALADCADIPGRIRVMSASYTGDAVPRAGSHDYTLLTAPERLGLACNDVFTVMGYTSIFGEPRAEYFRSYTQGLGPVAQPVWPPSSSFANPIALAHFICITRRYPQESMTSWEDRLTGAWSKPILDPLLYDEFPVEPTACAPQ